VKIVAVINYRLLACDDAPRCQQDFQMSTDYRIPEMKALNGSRVTG